MSSLPGPESPSERYRASAERAAEAKTYLGGFTRSLAFDLAPLQRAACLSRQAGRGGLLTGDTSINGEAPVVVMTTEVLRNMLYADSDTLDDLGFVVMDEVHYLADRFRGAVWEEVIIHLPSEVQV